MKSTSILAKIGTATAALVAPATLFLGAGTAQAAPAIEVRAVPAPAGVEVDVWAAEMSGWCTYTSTVQGSPIGKPAPALGVPFYLGRGVDGAMSASRLWFPSYPTGSTWNITVTCPNGVASTQTVW